MAEEAKRGADIGRKKERKKERVREEGEGNETRVLQIGRGWQPGEQAAGQPAKPRSERPSWVSAPTDVCIVVLYICSVHIIRASSSVCGTCRCPRPCRCGVWRASRTRTRVCTHSTTSQCMCVERRRRRRRRQKCIALLHQTVLNRTDFSLFFFVFSRFFFLPSRV